MKTTKRILAVMLAALMLVMTVPFAVSAATEDISFTVNCAKDGYEFTVYELATLDVDTGKYTKNANTADAIFAEITKENPSTQAILAKCDDATMSDSAAKGTYTSNTGEKTFTLPSGIYYIKATTQPTTVKSVTNSIVSLPYYDNNSQKISTLGYTINLAEKVREGSDGIDKEIVDGKINNKNTTAAYNETVTFKLTADVVGSTDKKLQAYKINDVMSAGLTFTGVSSVKLTGGTAADKTLVNNTDYTVNPATGGQTFNVTLNATNVLAKDFFYDYTEVEVICTAIVNENANTGAIPNTNEDSLDYTNANGVDSHSDGVKVNVYTYEVEIIKVDAANHQVKLAGAEFEVYKTENDAKNKTNAIAKAVTDNDGKGMFKINNVRYTFDRGTYYIRETKAPANYNLSTVINTVVIDGTNPGSDYNKSITIENTKPVLPQTGGPGTIAFTVIGASLIVCAGVLLIIIMKKRAK